MLHFLCGLLLSITKDKRTRLAQKISYTTTRLAKTAVFFLKSNRLTTNISYSDFPVEYLKISFWFDGRNRCESEAFSKTTSGRNRTAVCCCRRIVLFSCLGNDELSFTCVNQSNFRVDRDVDFLQSFYCVQCHWREIQNRENFRGCFYILLLPTLRFYQFFFAKTTGLIVEIALSSKLARCKCHICDAKIM